MSSLNSVIVVVNGLIQVSNCRVSVLNLCIQLSTGLSSGLILRILFSRLMSLDLVIQLGGLLIMISLQTIQLRLVGLIKLSLVLLVLTGLGILQLLLLCRRVNVLSSFRQGLLVSGLLALNGISISSVFLGSCFTGLVVNRLRASS